MLSIHGWSEVNTVLQKIASTRECSSATTSGHTSDNDNHEDGDVDSLAGNVQVPASRDDDSDNKKDVNDEHDEHDELCTYW